MNHILITSADYNRVDAARCAAWLLEYYRRLAVIDGIPAPRVAESVADLIKLRNDLAVSAVVGR